MCGSGPFYARCGRQAGHSRHWQCRHCAIVKGMTSSHSSAGLLMKGCDTHVHVIGPRDKFPMVQGRHYTPGPASVQELKAHLTTQGLGKAVIVQPSVYGTDNRCLLSAISDMGRQARGIAVLDAQISASELQELDAQGIRGIRLNFESSGNQSVDQLKQALADWAPRLEALGWHIQRVRGVAASAHSCYGLPAFNQG